VLVSLHVGIARWKYVSLVFEYVGFFLRGYGPECLLELGVDSGVFRGSDHHNIPLLSRTSTTQPISVMSQDLILWVSGVRKRRFRKIPSLVIVPNSLTADISRAGADANKAGTVIASQEALGSTTMASSHALGSSDPYNAATSSSNSWQQPNSNFAPSKLTTQLQKLARKFINLPQAGPDQRLPPVKAFTLSQQAS
jgi:hypothetical protein